MKKVAISLLVLVLIALAGVSAMLLMNSQPAAAQPKPQSSSTAPQIGVMKPVDTLADVMEELSYEISQNGDTVAWLKIPGTTINNSVLQSHNNITYLRHNERRQEDIYGCYFADYEGSVGSRQEMSPNTIIYGHSDLKDNPDGPRFSQLFKFTDIEFARNTPYIHFSTLEDYMKWEVFAVLYTDTEMDYIYPNVEPEVLTELINEAKLKSIYNYSVNVTGQDKILSLSTCSIKYPAAGSIEQRLVVMAKLVGEDDEGKVMAEVEENPNPLLPKLG